MSAFNYGNIVVARKLDRGAIRAAADWLDANPGRHVAGILACDLQGNTRMPTSKTATCFCALGRIAKEAGLKLPARLNDKYAAIRAGTGLNEEQVSRIVEGNDTGHYGDPHETYAGRRPGNRRVIEYLRQLAGSNV